MNKGKEPNLSFLIKECELTKLFVSIILRFPSVMLHQWAVFTAVARSSFCSEGTENKIVLDGAKGILAVRLTI